METIHEKNVPALQDQAQTHSRLPGALQHEERQGHPAPPPCQGPQTLRHLGFPKAFHLVRRREFLACYEQGRRLHSKGFILFVLQRPAPPEHWRVGLAVSKKTGHAVLRNRVKRLLREFFRLHGPEIPGGIDIVAVPKKHLDAAGLTLDILTRDLEPVISKLKASPEPASRRADS